jgi:hypothetical protein
MERWSNLADIVEETRQPRYPCDDADLAEDPRPCHGEQEQRTPGARTPPPGATQSLTRLFHRDHDILCCRGNFGHHAYLLYRMMRGA